MNTTFDSCLYCRKSYSGIFVMAQRIHILQLLPEGYDPPPFRSRVRRSIHYNMPKLWCFLIMFLLIEY
jgi:hypothetical protein